MKRVINVEGKKENYKYYDVACSILSTASNIMFNPFWHNCGVDAIYTHNNRYAKLMLVFERNII